MSLGKCRKGVRGGMAVLPRNEAGFSAETGSSHSVLSLLGLFSHCWFVFFVFFLILFLNTLENI